MSDQQRTPQLAPPAQSPWMTVPDAAEYARRGHTAIYNACRTGELKAGQDVAPRGKWRIHRDDVDAWLRAGSTAKPARRRGRTAA